jgi:hypothetical protein
MPSTSQPQQQRLTVKQADAEAQRSRMTQRRQQSTNRIRKQKKSDYLARKRNLPTTTSIPAASATATQAETATTVNTAVIQPLIQSYCQNPTSEHLHALQTTLRSITLTGSQDNPLVVLSQDEQSTAVALLEQLRTHAATPNANTVSLALQIVVQLTAISCTTQSSSSSNNNYYGYTPVSWSSLVSQDHAWLSLLVSLAVQEEAACVSLGNLVGDASSQVFATLRQAGMIPALVSVASQPAAAWALTNAIRHDTMEWARTYCNDQALSASLLEQLLQQPGPVATQAAWMMASLTSRESEVVQYLMRHASLKSTLVTCLERPVAKDQVVPLLQTLGNIASYEEYVAPLLALPSNLITALGRLLQTPNLQREVLVQAAWLAGCLLCDAGVEHHPSTSIAAPTLVPILFQELRADTPHSSLEEQRELASALWNALCPPPVAVASNARTALVPVRLPSKDIVRASFPTLVRLIASVDADAVVAAVNVVDLLLSRDDDDKSLQVHLEEHDVHEALEKVCDSAIEDAADVAANLLDDYFYKDVDGDDDEEQGLPHSMAFGNPSPSGMGRGMGRGRGATLPSWMPHN